MKRKILSVIAVSLLTSDVAISQGPRPTDIAASPQPVGDPGVMWYTTWESVWMRCGSILSASAMSAVTAATKRSMQLGDISEEDIRHLHNL